MNTTTTTRRCLAASLALALALVVDGVMMTAQSQSTVRAPMFQVDPGWPTLPNDWVLGEVSSIAVDSRDRVWVLHRPRSIPEAQRAKAAPPVLKFDSTG